MSFFDLEYELRTNKDFCGRLAQSVQTLRQLGHNTQAPSLQTQQTRKNCVENILHECHFNTSLLTGYYFPRYPKNEPLHYKDFLQAIPLFSIAPGGEITVRAGRQVSKSNSFCSRQRMHAHIYPGFKSLYLVPRSDQLKTYANTYRSMEKAFRFPVKDENKWRQNLYYKEYPNNSVVELVHCLTSADNVRGKFFDECFTKNTDVTVWEKGGWIRKNILHVQPGTTVLSFDTDKGVYSPDVVKRFAHKGKRHVWKITTDNGHTIECTGNQKIYTNHGWIYVAQLLNQQEAQRCEKTYYAYKHAVTNDMGYPAGRRIDAYAIKTETADQELNVWSAIRDIEYIGDHDVYDIETEAHHNFHANGLLVSNCILDEAQGFDANIWIEVREVFSNSKLQFYLFGGSSTTTDTFLEAKYEHSSRGVWVMQCPECGHFNIPTIEGNVMDMIQPEGPACVKCLQKRNRLTYLDVTSGSWNFESAEQLEKGYWGFHLPQIIVPAVVKNEKRWSNLYQLAKSGDSDPRKVYQEILGIPQEEGFREITIKDLENICCLGDDINKLEAKCRNRQYRFAVSGCDWGGSDYSVTDKTKVSYTVHVVLGITRDGNFDIIHMHRYAGMQYEEIIEHIMNKHRDLRGDVIGSDFGGGMWYNDFIRRRMNKDRHFVFEYPGSMSAKFLSMPSGGWKEHMYNKWMLNRNESLSALFTGIKHRRMRCYDWNIAGPRLRECLNSFRHMHETNTGRKFFSFVRHGSRPDDTLHALNYAYTLGRMVLGEKLFEDPLLNQQVAKQLNQPTTPIGKLGNWGGTEAF